MTVVEWDRRQLCPDGACIGVIGSDGLCKVCGRAAQGWGDERKRGLVADAAPGDDDLDEGEDYDDEDDEDELDDDEDQDDDVYDDDHPISPGSPALLGALAEWNERRLCVDGACIGLLADDGRCKVCGKIGSKARPGSATAAPPSDEAALEAAAGELAAIAPAVSLDDDLEARKLCPDGSCVGVIGAHGRCKVCGKEAA
ncbi:MAG: hypothetical protein H0T42_23900 [Deltaproteobacteria bacterium]|nr:hypothetical protein [Deltaproteobacteria bacterium]